MSFGTFLTYWHFPREGEATYIAPWEENPGKPMPPERMTAKLMRPKLMRDWAKEKETWMTPVLPWRLVLPAARRVLLSER